MTGHQKKAFAHQSWPPIAINTEKYKGNRKWNLLLQQLAIFVMPASIILPLFSSLILRLCRQMTSTQQYTLQPNTRHSAFTR